MCARYSLTVLAEDFARKLGASVQLALFGPDGFRPRYNAAPTQKLPVITGGVPRQLELLQWGLIPSWAKDPSIGIKLINARAETVLEKPSFRRPFQRQRCLVLADGFYEWQATERGKVPYRFVVRGGAPFAFAGLWDSWRDPSGPERRTFTILTTQPNDLVAPIHNRMPVILPETAYEHWLSSAVAPESLLPLLTPYPAEVMAASPVSRLVNSPHNDTPAVLAPPR